MTTAEKERILHELSTFMNAQGQLTKWPAKFKKRLYFLYYLGHQFEMGTEMTETEVNERLYGFHTFNDPAILRRELYNKKFLNRTIDCKKYWAEENPLSLDEFIEKYV